MERNRLTGRYAHLGVGFILCILTLFSPDTLLSVENEGRALWVVRTTLVSRSSIDRAIDYAVDGGFRILFVQAVGRGDAFYSSSILPVSELLDDASDADPFGYLLDKAHEHGLEVHIWLNLLYAWSSPLTPISPDHVVRRHPDWMVEHRELSVYGGSRLDHFSRDPVGDRFLSPALPEVRRHLSRVVEEILLKYRIDGLHLDYIRYPSIDVGFESFARGAFFAMYQVDPVDIFEPDLLNSSSEEGPDKKSLERQWYQWRSRQVTDLLREIREVQKTISPGITLSVAVIPDIEKARRNYGQDWPAWANEGLVDLVVTMSYSQRKGIVLSQAREAREAILRGRLFIGVAVYNKPLNSVLDCVRELRKLDIDGISFFSYNSMLENPGYFSRVRKYLFDDAPLPAGSADQK